LQAFVPRRLPLLLCLRAATQALRRCKTKAQDLSVAVADRKGVLTRSLEPLVMLAGSLRVFTPDIAQYRATAAGLQERYGATLLLGDSPACLANSSVVIADDLTLFTGRERGLIFTQDRRTDLPGCRIACGRLPSLRPATEALRPEGIDPLLFAAALYELCGAGELEQQGFEQMSLRFAGQEETMSVQALAALIDLDVIPKYSRI
jgi:uncharacterized protein GlcG (DUF336 family)